MIMVLWPYRIAFLVFKEISWTFKKSAIFAEVFKEICWTLKNQQYLKSTPITAFQLGMQNWHSTENIFGFQEAGKNKYFGDET